MANTPQAKKRIRRNANRAAVNGARVGRLVDLEVDAPTPQEARAQVERMCRQLLANPLIESFEIEIEGQAA